MIKPTEDQIREIAENLDSGMICHFNKTTGEIRTMVDPDRWPDQDEFAEDDENPIDLESGDYEEFERMSSDDEFGIMVDFTASLPVGDAKQRLIGALNRPKPFRNFKNEIAEAGEIRERWFEYKNQRYIEWVKEQVDALFCGDESS